MAKRVAQPTKRVNRTDLTLRNLAALKKRLGELETRVTAIEALACKECRHEQEASAELTPAKREHDRIYKP